MKVALVSSAGGHLTELSLLAHAFPGEHHWVTYRDARTEGMDAHYAGHLGRNPFNYARELASALRYLRRLRPDLVVSTGSEIAIPYFIAAKALRIPTLYVDTVCRTTGTSGTGRVLYRVADRFLVQWPHMAQAYGDRAEHHGGLL